MLECLGKAMTPYLDERVREWIHAMEWKCVNGIHNPLSAMLLCVTIRVQMSTTLYRNSLDNPLSIAYSIEDIRGDRSL